MNQPVIILRYTICFIKKENRILLLKRAKEPWKSCWNGIGGKLHADETALESVVREAYEETGIDLGLAKELNFTGIVTWNAEVEPGKTDENMYGMYVFLAEMAEDQEAWTDERSTREGILAWKPTEWIVDQNNREVAHNIPYFLPQMIKNTNPLRYHSYFKGDKFDKVTLYDMPRGVSAY